MVVCKCVENSNYFEMKDIKMKIVKVLVLFGMVASFTGMNASETNFEECLRLKTELAESFVKNQKNRGYNGVLSVWDNPKFLEAVVKCHEHGYTCITVNRYVVGCCRAGYAIREEIKAIIAEEKSRLAIFESSSENYN